MAKLVRIRWGLNEDGTGTAQVMLSRPGAMYDRPYTFNSLDELPPEVASIIRKDGRLHGEWPQS